MWLFSVILISQEKRKLYLILFQINFSINNYPLSNFSSSLNMEFLILTV